MALSASLSYNKCYWEFIQSIYVAPIQYLFRGSTKAKSLRVIAAVCSVDEKCRPKQYSWQEGYANLEGLLLLVDGTNTNM